MTQTVLEKLDSPSEGRIQCDGCSAKAQIKVNLPYGDLAFCNHHYNKHAQALTEQGGVAKLLAIEEQMGTPDAI